MKALDRHTIQTQHIPGILLMEHAGKEVAEVVRQRQPHNVVVLCGKGNNGGDGWIAARWLKHWGIPVDVVSTVEPAELQGDAAAAAAMAVASRVPFRVVTASAKAHLPAADVYVDALLGTGVTRPVTGFLRELMEAVNAAPGWRVAVDVPSGVDASTGQVQGAAIQAQQTIAMAAQKIGTAVTPGCLYAGTVHVVDIGIPVPSSDQYARLTRSEWVAEHLPKRSNLSHKGTFGRVGIAVGRMQGASVLAGLGAARCGAGLVVLSGPAVPVTAPLDFVQRPFDASAFADCSTLVIGPGLGTDAGHFAQLVHEHRGTGVVDADGLSLLREGAQLHGEWVLTPHPKECGRLLQWSTEQVQAHRVQAAQALAAKHNAVVVLKGFRTIVAHPDQRMCVVSTGDASLATAGTGDVLAGMIGGMLAQGLPPFEAAAVAAHLHGLAGELAGQSLSKASVMATDVVEFISRAIRLHFDRGSEK